jgi:cytochrome c oxidase subunit II
MSPKTLALGLAAGSGAALAGASLALAAQPAPWEMGFQPAATPIMHRIVEFNDLVFPIIVAITAFVLALMIYVFFRFNARSNPKPSRTSHNTLIEVIWTVVPAIILVVIAIPSLRLLYFEERLPPAELTIKAIGHQWYWSYEYPDNGNFTFDANLKEKAALQQGEPYLLATDNHVVIPAGTVVRVLVTAEDVIHSWAVPSFGIKKDAVPGRTAELWVQVDEPGVYYGQCSELCGTNHGYMPIAVEVVSKEDFARWVADAQQRFAKVDGAEPAVAAIAASN